MRLEKLRISGLRCLDAVELDLHAGMNLLTGANGSGKTSVLEAVHVLSHGRSFRGGGHVALTRRSGSRYDVFAELVTADEVRHRLGMGHGEDGWRLRLDGAPLKTLGAAVSHFASVCFEPGSHALIAGAASERRRYMDWGVFHVEHQFMGCWQRYRQALRQRNAVLRQGGSDRDLAVWETQMVDTGSQLDAWRRDYLQAVEPGLQAEVGRLVGDLGEARLSYRCGWAGDKSLDKALADARARDRGRGYTSVGPQRADWRVRFEAVPQHDQLSRGQEKLVALACLLAQAEHLAGIRGDWPVVCLDDLAAELDQRHQRQLVQRLLATGAQVLVTGTELPQALTEVPLRMFHVEHGRINAA